MATRASAGVKPGSSRTALSYWSMARRTARQHRSLDGSERARDGGGHGTRHGFRNRLQRRIAALVLTSPDVHPIGRPQQLDRDGRALAPTGPPHAAADEIRHAEGAPQGCWIIRRAAKAANGVAGLHAESLDSAEAGDDGLSEPVSEVGGRCVRSLEVQDGDARR